MDGSTSLLAEAKEAVGKVWKCDEVVCHFYNHELQNLEERHERAAEERLVDK